MFMRARYIICTSALIFYNCYCTFMNGYMLPFLIDTYYLISFFFFHFYRYMMLSWLRDKVKTLQNKNLLLIGLTISFIALAFQMIGFLFPFWMSSNDGPYSVTAGLWQVCGMDGDSECLDIQVAGPGLPGKKESYTRKKPSIQKASISKFQ